jgi:hypothetical protein
MRHRQYRMAGGDPNRALGLYFNPEWNIVVLLADFQEWSASTIMKNEDYDCYLRLTVLQNFRLMPHDKFLEEMGALLQSPRYKILRLWWHIHRMDVCGMRRMVNNPFLFFQLVLCVTMNIVLHLSYYGDTLWNRFLNTVRRRRR